VVICPNGAIYVAYLGFDAANEQYTFIARAPFVGAPFVIVENHASLVAKFPLADPTLLIVYDINCNSLLPEDVAYIVGELGSGTVYHGNGTVWTAGVVLACSTAAISFGGDNGDNKWEGLECLI